MGGGEGGWRGANTHLTVARIPQNYYSNVFLRNEYTDLSKTGIDGLGVV